MISVCTTTYRETEELEVFVRSLFVQASEDNVELVIVNDEDYQETSDVLYRLQQEYPITIIPRSKEKRIEYIKGLIDFYDRNSIFSSEYIEEMRIVLQEYRESDMALWLPASHNFNLASKQAKGDVYVFMPADYLIFFDASKVYKRAKDAMITNTHAYGHFDWLDTGSFGTDYILPKLTKEKIAGICKEMLDSNPQVVQAQHGSRLVNKELYEQVGGFDDRWFTRAISDDLFNEHCKAVWGGMYRLKEWVYFLDSPVYVGTLRSDSSKNYRYLTPSYSISADKHWKFVSRIKEWIQQN